MFYLSLSRPNSLSARIVSLIICHWVSAVNNDAVIFIVEEKKSKGKELLRLSVSMNYEIIRFNYHIFSALRCTLCPCLSDLSHSIYVYVYGGVSQCLKLCY